MTNHIHCKSNWHQHSPHGFTSFVTMDCLVKTTK